MSAPEVRDSEESHYSKHGEEKETDVGLLRVRAALLSLPKAACPAGFEYRLQRRLRGQEEKLHSSTRGWASGWAGVGLGFVCAAVIALFVLNFNGTQPGVKSMTAQQVAPPVTVNPGPDQIARSDDPKVQAGENQDGKMLAQDTAKQQGDPAHISPDRLMQASDKP